MPRRAAATDPLIAFLAARLDEDEAVVRVSLDAPENATRFTDMDRYSEGVVWRFADEDRVLREVEAKRAILARHAPEPMRNIEAHRCPKCELTWPCAEIRTVVAVYNDHPDYQPEWKTP